MCELWPLAFLRRWSGSWKSSFICCGYVLVVILLSIYFCTVVCMVIQKLQCIAVEIFRHTAVVTAMVKMEPQILPHIFCVKFGFWCSTNLCPFILYFVDSASRYSSLPVNSWTHVFISLFITPLYMFRASVLIIRRSNCINTSSEMISLCK